MQKPSAPIVLFLSVDIAGATAYKVEHPASEEDDGWLDAFEKFFRLTPLRFLGRVAQAFMAQPEIPDTSVWRVLGDETIFIARPRSPMEVQQIIIAFLRTIHDCNETIMSEYELGVRGCVWAAQMSGRNRAIHIPEMHASYLDYLGPDVDTGFRISGFADAGEVSFSYNVLKALESLPPNDLLRFRSLGTKVLKGVITHEPYPVVVSTAADALDGPPDSAGSDSAEADSSEANPAQADSFSVADLMSTIRSEHPNTAALESGLIEFG
ncbi:MAG: hypothetical protein ACC655_07220 [Rhodothermia bacterium]